jgi:hypothetical protein
LAFFLVVIPHATIDTLSSLILTFMMKTNSPKRERCEGRMQQHLTGRIVGTVGDHHHPKRATRPVS